MSSPATPQRGGGRPARSKGTRKRSASSPFASLFATLASFSSSNSHAEAASSPQPAQPNAAASRYQNDSAAAPADASRSRGHRRSQRRSESRSQAVMAPSHSAQQSRAAITAAPAAATSTPTSTSKALTRRQSTPQKQVVRHSRPPSTVSTANGGTKPNVFAFMSGEISTPPTPRPRAGAPKGLGITDGKPIERSASIKQVSAPIPRRPLLIPQSASSLSSEQSDSDDTVSTVDSPPETPTPQQARALAAAQAATKSLERVTGQGQGQGQGQDAVGRSLRTPEYFKQIGRTQPTTPPEAPMPPHMMQQYQQPHVASVYDYQQSPQGFSYPSTPGHFGQSNSFSRPYPTPPLDQPSSGLTTSKSGGTLSDLQQSELSLLREAVDGSTSGKMPELLPRQYRALTLTTIKRTEVMIDSLEAELRSLEKSAPIMQREHLTMRLTNTLVMHHRLVDTWSKVSQLSPLKMTKLEDRQKIEAVWVQLRQQYAHLPHINGMGVDKFISNVVNDLVHVGEHAQSDQKEDGGSASARTQDLRIVMVLLGVVLTFLLLKDEAFQKVAIVAGVVLGVYAFSQANVQSHVLGARVDSTKNRGLGQ